MVVIGADALIRAAGGSPLIISVIALLGLAILMHKLQVGFAASLMIVTFTVAILSMTFDTSTFGNIQLPFSIFNLMFLLIVMGVAVLFALSIAKDR